MAVDAQAGTRQSTASVSGQSHRWPSTEMPNHQTMRRCFVSLLACARVCGWGRARRALCGRRRRVAECVMCAPRGAPKTNRKPAIRDKYRPPTQHRAHLGDVLGQARRGKRRGRASVASMRKDAEQRRQAAESHGGGYYERSEREASALNDRARRGAGGRGELAFRNVRVVAMEQRAKRAWCVCARVMRAVV